MKNRTRQIVTGIVLASLLAGGSQAAELAYWNFDEGSGVNVADSVGSNDGEYIGVPVNGDPWVAGPTGFGSALEFNGGVFYTPPRSTQVYAGDTLNPTGVTGQMSIATWVKWGHLENGEYVVAPNFGSTIISKETDSDPDIDVSAAMWILAMHGTKPNPDDNGITLVRVANSGGTNPTEPDDSSIFGFGFLGSQTQSLPTLGEWTHLAVTFDGTDTKFYLDGALQPNRVGLGNTNDKFYLPSVTTPAMENARINIGSRYVGTAARPVQQDFDGALDEMHIYDHALSLQEIQALMSVGLPGDFDNDGDVDGADFLFWQRDPGVGSLSDWQTNYDGGGNLAATQSVPEPASLVLAVIGFAACLRRNASRDR